MANFHNFLMFLSERSGAVSFGMYEIKKSLTPLGWAVIITAFAILIFGVIFSIKRILKKKKIK